MAPSSSLMTKNLKSQFIGPYCQSTQEDFNVKAGKHLSEKGRRLPPTPTPSPQKKEDVVLFNSYLIALRLGSGLMLEVDMKMRRIMEQLTFWSIWLSRQVVRLFFLMHEAVNTKSHSQVRRTIIV